MRNQLNFTENIMKAIYRNTSQYGAKISQYCKIIYFRGFKISWFWVQWWIRWHLISWFSDVNTRHYHEYCVCALNTLIKRVSSHRLEQEGVPTRLISFYSIRLQSSCPIYMYICTLIHFQLLDRCGFLCCPILVRDIHIPSLSKKFYSSQAQRAGYRQNLEARKKLHKPELFFCQSI